MIKHVIFTDHTLAKVFCYDLAAVLTKTQRRAGVVGYSAAEPHPDGAQWSVMVDTSNTDVMTMVNAGGHTLADLDETWFPLPQIDPQMLP